MSKHEQYMSLRPIFNWILDFQFTWWGLGYIFCYIFILKMISIFIETGIEIFNDYAKEKNWSVIKQGLAYLIIFVTTFFILAVVGYLSVFFYYFLNLD